MQPIHHLGEEISNARRDQLIQLEARSQRTFTPSQAVIARSAGVFHWTPEGKKLFDFTSGVLVANLGHNPNSWMRRFYRYMNWPESFSNASSFFEAVPMTAYNGVTPIEMEASQRLIEFTKNRPGGSRLNQVMWAASGSEAIQKALWAAMARDKNRPMILATRFGFHGKKGLANAVTGSEQDSERDPRVRFISFPMQECADVSKREDEIDLRPFRHELHELWDQFDHKIGVMITEPYLGGGGSYHPQKSYLQMLQAFCHQHDLIFILDEVQSNFGRTGKMFAYETYGLEPDMVVLGKGLGNGVPVAAVLGRGDIFSSLQYGEASDTWSANPLNCASVLATLDEFEERDVLGPMQEVSKFIEAGLIELKKFPFVEHVRGEQGGMVWGLEFRPHANLSGGEWANRFVLEGYLGDGGTTPGVHLLGPLAKKVVRISPPLVITQEEASNAMAILHRAAQRMNSET
ncbi:aminotransferase class III-fold pyridoxal phosphate-dependent enzyme [Telmatocola sphagniphila]|uniref:Aminotransferase class III-fold pyridoxal phosphate-dependent enzyme n=1 Tax=Telmatocola sphagniphila TaxID=1123043 RepID=A0A8E6B7N9_9BACT|nr:aminotransferase class III-fold pyridoxal phosphate-dependent enzyme [Telmatocola sphagniphila]QVL33388.1 aminotransferase class III-fold pyridoxal phosphate-dependent enzyme [Telmatocola sphagniphila]